jgi:hypothetical protein
MARDHSDAEASLLKHGRDRSDAENGDNSADSFSTQKSEVPHHAFVRAKGGLGNKLRVVLSYREAHVIDGGMHLVVVWVVDEECPARFLDLFEPLGGVTFVDSDDPAIESKLRALGAPEGTTMPRDMRTHPSIAACHSEAERWLSEREAAMYLNLRPLAELADEVAQCVARNGSSCCAVHVRRTDHVKLWGISTPDSEFFRFVDAHAAADATVFVATDNVDTQTAFQARYGSERVRTVAPIDAAPTTLRHTPLSDAVIDLYVCAAAEIFKGTRGSSFSDAIWMLRRARGCAHQHDELHTSRQLRRRRWRQQRAAACGAARTTKASARTAGTETSDGLQASSEQRTSLHVVVAHHSSRSYESLLTALAPDVEHVVVYDKSAKGISGAPPGHEVVRVPNCGRESESYLRHIVSEYDALPDYVLFVQDDTHVHVPHHHQPAFCARVRAIVRSEALGEVLQVVYRGKRLYPPRCIDEHDKLYPKLRAVCERFEMGALPSAYATNVCAFVLASRECIRRRPRSFYERLLSWHSEEHSVRNRRGATEEQLAPWLLEHLWQRIFFPEDHGG